NEARAKLEEDKSKIAHISQKLSESEERYSAVCQQLHEKYESESKESQKQEKIEVELKEKEKYLSSKKKKAEKSLKQEVALKAENKCWMENFSKDLTSIESEKSQLLARLSEEEKILEAISDSLKEVFQNQIAKKQLELVPWTDKINEIRSKIDIAESELKLLTDDRDNSKTMAESTAAKLYELKRQRSEKGRLGDLGVIDEKYDVAITTACGPLEHIVVETVDCGQKCIELLKAQNLGRASFICLDKVARMPDKRPNLPENSKRLFDLITPKEPRFKDVFYKVLGDTLVTSDLKLANKIAFGGSTRRRVVTLEGQLIENSGVMSGGGQKPQAGGMSSKFQQPSITESEIQSLEKEESIAEMALEQHITKRKTYETEHLRLIKELPSLEFKLSKCKMEVESLSKQICEMESNVKVVSQKRTVVGQSDLNKIRELEQTISAMRSEALKLENSKKTIDDDIKHLQEQILQAGGVKIRSQKATVDGINQQIDVCDESIKKIQIEKACREKTLTKLDGSLEIKERELKEISEGTLSVEENLRDVRSARNLLKSKLSALETELENITSEKDSLKNTLDSDLKAVTNFKKIEITATISQLKYQTASDDGLEPLREYSAEELAQFDAAVLEHDIEKLNLKLGSMSPNLSVLVEFRQKESLYLSRFKEVEESTQRRYNLRLSHENLCKRRLNEFMDGFYKISYKLKEMYQMITLGGNAELELVDSLDPFSEGVIFSVMPPKKSWKNICNLSGGEKTLSSLALVFALHHYKPTPLYFMDEIDAALDFKNVSIVANYVKDRTKNAQFIIISLRNNMFELADRLVGIYK
ncbi:hypothetical protein HDU82_002709, partial [Entophlyctis luteolus]